VQKWAIPLPGLRNAVATQTVAMLSPQLRPFHLDRKGVFPSGRFFYGQRFRPQIRTAAAAQE
jgi:hypothetical protein